MNRRNLIKAALPLAAAAAVPASVGAAATRGRAPHGHFADELPSGATWTAEVPRNWNGTLVLYSHGYRPPFLVDVNEPQNAPSPAVAEALLRRGCALAGSSYSGLGWVMDTAVGDQLATLAAVEAITGPARTRIAFGTSMGALVTSRLIAAGNFDGAVTVCGPLAGGARLVDNQLNGDFALAHLLLDDPAATPLSGFTDSGQAQASARSLTEAAARAQHTVAGRARFALAAALYHLPTRSAGTEPAPHDHLAQVATQARFIAEGLPRVFLGSRFDIEGKAGGPVAGNVGTDYAKIFERLGTRRLVRALYRDAGSDLGADLGRLTRHARIRPQPQARTWLHRTSDPVAALSLPHLSLHTVADEMIPVEHESAYADLVHDVGRARFLRRAYADRFGHTEFTTAELVAAVGALAERIHRGRWGSLADAAALQRRALGLGLDGAAFTSSRPGEL